MLVLTEDSVHTDHIGSSSMSSIVETFSLTEYTLGSTVATLNPDRTYTVLDANNYSVADWFIVEGSQLRLADGVRLVYAASGPQIVKDGVGSFPADAESGMLEITFKDDAGVLETAKIPLLNIDESIWLPSEFNQTYSNGVICADFSTIASTLDESVETWVIEPKWADHFIVTEQFLALRPDRHFSIPTTSEHAIRIETITVNPSTKLASKSWTSFTSNVVKVTGFDLSGNAVCMLDVRLSPTPREITITLEKPESQTMDLVYGEILGSLVTDGASELRPEVVTMTTDQYLTLNGDTLALSPNYRIDVENNRIERFDGVFFEIPEDSAEITAQLLLYGQDDESPSALIEMTESELFELLHDADGRLDTSALARPGIDDNTILNSLISDTWFLPSKMLGGYYALTYALSPAGETVTEDGKTFDGGQINGRTVAWAADQVQLLETAKAAIESVAAVKIMDWSRFVDTSWNASLSEDDNNQTRYGGEVSLSGDLVQSYAGVGRLGIEPAAPIDATGMSTLHLSIWRTDPQASLSIKLIDFGSDGLKSTFDDSEDEITLTPDQVPAGHWTNITLPLTDLTALTTSEHIGQIVISSLSADGSYSGEELFLDEIYFSKTDKSPVPNHYALVFSDEFDEIGQSPNSDYWTFDLGASGWGNNEVQEYQGGLDDAVIVGPNEEAGLDTGALKITAKNQDGTITSARIKSQLDESLGPYGYYEIRAKLPSEPGAWPAVWLLGEMSADRPWPDAGEIDLVEWSSRFFDETAGDTISSALHFRGTPQQSQSYGDTQFKWEGEISSPVDEWHLYQLWWTPDEIRIGVDGDVESAHLVYTKPLNATNDDWPYDHAMDIILNLAIGGTLGGDVPDSDFSYDMYIDYVRIYQALDHADASASEPLRGPDKPTDPPSSVLPIYSETYLPTEPDKRLQLVETIDGNVAGTPITTPLLSSKMG